ncbi:hypothetical protein L218DRAFT_904238 [Marasmius fiardii PR-910]|nr:hypothetical protein L218DRAFT_904238 [Marasmius fiardii PR-910]
MSRQAFQLSPSSDAAHFSLLANTSMSTFQTETLVVNTPRANGLYALKMVVKRYTRATPTKPTRGSRDVSLVVMHGHGLTKEQWEPTLEKLWEQAESDPDLSQCYRITEVWAPEWHSHGESAILNRAVIQSNSVRKIVVSHWGIGLAAFIREGHLENKRVIFVGFSSGNLAMLNCLREFSASKPPVVGLVIVEPILFDKETASPSHSKSQAVFNLLIKGVRSQAETWRNREEAKKYLTKRPPWCLWDQTVLANYLQHGLMDFVDAGGDQAVKTICPRDGEAAVYENYSDTWSAMSELEQLSPFIPIHVVFGGREKFIPQEWRAGCVDVSKGRNVAGVHTVPEAAHMIPQEKPAEFAKLLSQLVRDIVVHNPLAKL